MGKAHRWRTSLLQDWALLEGVQSSVGWVCLLPLICPSWVYNMLDIYPTQITNVYGYPFNYLIHLVKYFTFILFLFYLDTIYMVEVPLYSREGNSLPKSL
jgi:sterol desaturase/sphingolipid hydroxylase (fatty acid hydroxylase superfamily)